MSRTIRRVTEHQPKWLWNGCRTPEELVRATLEFHRDFGFCSRDKPAKWYRGLVESRIRAESHKEVFRAFVLEDYAENISLKMYRGLWWYYS